MKDYSDYHPTRKEKMLHDAKKLFDFNVTGFSGSEVIVNKQMTTKVIMYDKYSASQSVKTVIAEKDSLTFGDIVTFDDGLILLIGTLESENVVTKKWVAKKCNITLKWVDDEGEIQESPCVLDYNAKSNFGVEEGKVMSLPDGRRQVILPKTLHTLGIAKRDKRFIIGGEAFKSIDCDYVSDEGLVNLSLQSTQIDPAIDNVEMGIANYDKVAKYSIYITNSENTSISIDQSLQLNVEAFKNTTPIPINELTFTSLDEYIATVNSNGLITPVSTGTVYIQANYKNASAQIKLTVRDIQYNNYTVDIEGSEFIYLGAKQTYKAMFKNNGAETSEKAVFSLFDEDGKSVTKKAIVSGIQGNSITLLGDTKLMGYIVLSVTSENGLIKGSRKLRVKGYL
ncbi:Ig-like domain-containing protein [Paenibacillus sp. FSL L8-0506]|uniref:Ig-like domain-containing protein n=1 Tax=Paenibacillus sp. FSL L8-0506 TaxID=2975335 RepID=UPI0030FC0F12